MIGKTDRNIEPEEYSSIAKVIIAFKWRLEFKQYIKNKPTKWKTTLFSIAGASGISYDVLVYVSKGTEHLGYWHWWRSCAQTC